MNGCYTIVSIRPYINIDWQQYRYKNDEPTIRCGCASYYLLSLYEGRILEVSSIQLNQQTNIW